MGKAFRSYLQLLLIIVLLTGNSCQRNSTESSPNPPIDPLAEKVTASLQGRVLDENGKPVNNADIKAGANSTTTDINGVFRFNNIQLNKNAGFVLVEKTGYLNGSRTFLPNAGVLNSVEIQLIPKVTRGSFSSAAGGNIVIQNGSTVVFPANAINTATNQAYTGIVKVIGACLDPTNPKLSAIMPGNLTGITIDNQQRALQTFGMMAVELEGDSGEKLNIADGKIVMISMPIPASMLAAAPATIPLWYFDETKGTWIEEGSATKTGSSYVGTVKHFSFWYCGITANFIKLKMKLLDQNNQPLTYHKVRITNLQNKSSTDGYTDSTGVVIGPVPNASLNIEVYNHCGESIHSQPAGPYNSNTDLGNILVNIELSQSLFISGNVINCSGGPVTNGFVDIMLEGITYRAITDTSGHYSIAIKRCNSGITNAMLVATDMQANQQGVDTVTLAVSTGVINVSVLKTCSTNSIAFLKLFFKGEEINLSRIYAYSTYENTRTTLTGRLNQPYIFFDFTFLKAFGVGVYPMKNWMMIRQNKNGQITDTGQATHYYPIDCKVNVTEFGGPAQFIAGSFRGNVTDSTRQTVLPIEGSFRAQKSY